MKYFLSISSSVKCFSLFLSITFHQIHEVLVLFIVLHRINEVSFKKFFICFSFDITYYKQKGPILREELKILIKDMDALFCLLTDKIDAEVLDHAERLKVIGSMAVGYDHLELPAIKVKGIRVGYTPDVLTQATAELTVALLLATSRRLFDASRYLRR